MEATQERQTELWQRAMDDNPLGTLKLLAEVVGARTVAAMLHMQAGEGGVVINLTGLQHPLQQAMEEDTGTLIDHESPEDT